ncbi:MAG: phosphotransferase family protein [Granulosicoccus sp.]|nr:phosphotransferase family protein [Granulosicoccus sp.]
MDNENSSDDSRARAEVLAALRELTHLKSVTTNDYTATRQGGLTNLVFKIEFQGSKSSEPSLIVRLAGKGTEDYIDRKVEDHNARVAASAGVSAEVLYTHPDSGVMVSRCIPDIVTMTPELFSTRTGSVARAGVALRKLHSAKEPFEFRFELFSMIEEYLGILSTKDIELPEGYHDIVERAEPVKQVLADNPVALAPCHCDPLCENFLDDGSMMWIVDWEYSGMNDPYWDLGDLAVEGNFSESQTHELVRAYCNGEPSASEMARVTIYKAMCDLLWTLWGLIQHADKNPADDFWAYSIGRFERCKALVLSANFDECIGAVAHSG